MATALLDRNNSAVTATLNEEEYVIESIQRVFNHANIDDNASHWTLICVDRTVKEIFKKMILQRKVVKFEEKYFY